MECEYSCERLSAKRLAEPLCGSSAGGTSDAGRVLLGIARGGFPRMNQENPDGYVGFGSN